MRAISFVLCFIFCLTASLNAVAYLTAEEEGGLVVRRESRTTLVSTENGEIVAARVGEDIDGGSYLLHFFTMDPNSLFLPVILHSDMVFYVHTGSGKLSWTDENEVKTAYLRRGDVYSLKSGAVFFVESNLETETERHRLRITSIFANSNTHLQEPETGPYSSIRDMILGFDKKVLQAAFKVPDEVIQELFDGTKPPAIIHGVSKGERRAWDMETTFLRSLLLSRTYNIFESNKKKGKSGVKLFNLLKEDKDFENRNGWSTTVTKKKLSALKGTNIGLFMVNLTAGAMMGPHWNPTATEIGIVLRGRGMIHVVCSGVWNGTECSDSRFEVEEGDIFVVPKFLPMAQMAFNNESFVFMGFSNSAKKNHPQFLAGQASVLRTLSKDVLAKSFNVEDSTLDRLLASEEDSVILSCVSCAEEELRILEEEREKEREEEREREEEEAREREEERRREEEEEREREEEAKRQEEERKRREEEEAEAARRREEEEEREREEEEAKKQEEERKRREEEEAEAARRREEEEEREREEEEAKKQEEERKRREEEEAEAARKREEEEAREREEEEAERQEKERKRREEEQEAEAARRKEEEEAREREREEEEAERQEEKRKRREEEQEAEAARRREEEEAREREEEAAEREEEERKRREEEEEEVEAARRRRKEERKRREEEEEERMARREEEERRRREEEVRRREEEQRRREEEEEEEEEKEERARQREEEEEHREKRRRRKSEEEEASEEEEERRREEEQGP